MSRWRRAAFAVAGCAAAVYACAYADLILRARSAYLEGEKYLAWSRDPSLKAAHYDHWLAGKEESLRRDFSKGRMTQEELDERLKLARFERDQRVAESALKYAYVWFQTALELFSPPESRWVALSRQELARTKELWKKELDAKHVHYEEYMFD